MLYLVDASIFIFRAYHTVPNSLTDRDGNPVNALHGFARFIGELLERVSPTHIAVAFDASLSSSFRHQLYPPYKANREPAPAELKRQFELCRQTCDALGIATFVSSSFEADDIIGTLATMARAAGENVVLVTRDKDLAQLVRQGDQYWDYIADKRFAYHQIEDRFGVLPERMPCFLALMGDAVDNIPGVPGIGRKTASLLFRHFESLYALYDDLDRLSKLKLRSPGFVRTQLDEHRERAFLARRLTEIACDMPLQIDFEGLRRRRPNLDALHALYDAANFGPLLRNQAVRILERAA
jgi:DNA polymerase-1